MQYRLNWQMYLQSSCKGILNEIHPTPLKKVAMWLRNTDKEVECFHPVCGEALTSALKALLSEVKEK